jgi:hypothetical protein
MVQQSTFWCPGNVAFLECAPRASNRWTIWLMKAWPAARAPTWSSHQICSEILRQIITGMFLSMQCAERSSQQLPCLQRDKCLWHLPSHSLKKRGKSSHFAGNFKFMPIVRFWLKPLGHFEKFLDIILIRKTTENKTQLKFFFFVLK